jgi:hypothetical protein
LFINNSVIPDNLKKYPPEVLLEGILSRERQQVVHANAWPHPLERLTSCRPAAATTQVPTRPVKLGSAFSMANAVHVAAVDLQAFKSPTVTIYTDLFLMAKHRHLTGAIRLWSIARSLDHDGRGIVRLADLFKLVNGCQIHRSTFYSWLAQAREIGFVRDGQLGWICLLGLAKMARRLKVDRITRRIEISAELLTRPGWFGFVFASVHNSRPTSRRMLAILTGVPTRTQTRYDHQAGTHRKKSIYVTNLPANQIESVKEFSGESTAFIFYDKNTRLPVVAHRRPDARTPYGQPELCRRGWEINRVLSSANNRNYPIFGSRGPSVQKIFYQTAKQATRAAQRNGRLDLPLIDTFYPMRRTAAATFYLLA